MPSQPSDFPQGAVLGDRYAVDSVLGRGGNGVTYRCRDKQTGHLVAVKVLSLKSLRDWKQLDLFEREAQTLENLDHPGIPKYIDSFEEDSEADRAFFLVQELAEGSSLEALVSRGWRGDEREISRIALELLNILQYLGSRRPAVVHRDVKPSNIVVGGGKSGGRVYLVDFGGVQAAAAAGDLPGSTVIGTYGFMAPEQFRGAAQPASDMYGLGATLLYLLSGRPPSAFPVDRMRLDLSSVAMGATMEAVVEGLLEPVLEDRLTAEEAMALLTGRSGRSMNRKSGGDGGGGGGVGGSVFRNRAANGSSSSSSTRNTSSPSMTVQARPSGGAGVSLRKPPGSRIIIKKRGPRLEIEIPPAKFDSSTVATGGFALAWNAFVAFWTVSAFAGGGILFALFSIPFWVAGASLAKQAFGRQFLREHLEIGLGKWKLKQQLAGLRGRGDASEVDWSGSSGKEVGGRSEDLLDALLQVTGYINGDPQAQLVLRQGVEKYTFGESLDPIEQEYLAEVINAHLTEVAATRGEIEGFAGGGDNDDNDDSSVDSVDFVDFDEEERKVQSSEFAEFDRKLGGEAVRAAEAAAAEARMVGVRAAVEARRAVTDAQLKAKRAIDQAQRRPSRSSSNTSSSSSSTIDLGSGEFDILDD